MEIQKKKLAVVILNWNGKKFLRDYLPSVIENSPEWVDIVVADNNSTDDSIEFLKSNFPSVIIVQNSTNLGFAKGYNEALNSIEAEYYCLLNSDVEVSANWINPIIDLMDSDENIAACQPKVKSLTNKQLFEYAGACGGFIDFLAYPFCRGRIFDDIEEDKGQYDSNIEIFWASGACIFVRSDIFKKIDGFDSDFFMHMEEIDLCWRMKNLGYKIYVCADSEVYHLGGGSLPKSDSRKTFYNFRNSLYCLIKNTQSGSLLYRLLIRLILDGIAGLNFIIKGRYSDFFAIIKAHFSVYFNFKLMLNKRRNIKINPIKSNMKGMMFNSIVKLFFLKKKKIFSEIDVL